MSLVLMKCVSTMCVPSADHSKFLIESSLKFVSAAGEDASVPSAYGGLFVPAERWRLAASRVASTQFAPNSTMSLVWMKCVSTMWVPSADHS